MSTVPTLPGITKNALTARWKELTIGVMSLCLAWSLSWVSSDMVALRDKLKSIPDPAQIATVKSVDQRFAEEDKKVDTSTQDTKESLKRIETKVDALVMAMATARRLRAAGPEDPDYSARGTPSSSVFIPLRPKPTAVAAK